jgi:hypothetical protein
VRSAGDTRIVIADHLLAPPLELVLSEVQILFHHPSQILFDLVLVLRGGRNDLGLQDTPLRIQPI